MQEIKKIKKSRKKTTLVDLSSKQRSPGRAKPNKDKPKISCQDKRVQTIKKAANGCWWIEQYLMADITTPKNKWGIGDE